jgi:hypothetical protein
MLLAKRIAELTNDPNDIAVAEAAAKSYNAHEFNQSKVDAKN